MGAGLREEAFSGSLSARLSDRGEEKDGVRLFWLGQAGLPVEGAGRRIPVDPICPIRRE